MATAFAVYSADDNSLNFYKRDTVPAAGDTFNGKTATEVYTGIETDTYNMFESPWWSNRTSITSVSFVDSGIAPVSTAFWFPYMNNASLTTISGLDKLDTSNVTSMNSMFRNCLALTSLDLSGWDTANVTDMSNMFYYCKALTSLDLGSFDTANVTNMSYMFYDCEALTSLDVSSFDTSNVTSMDTMFCLCSALTSLDISSFDTAKVTDMGDMFGDCRALTSLDLSSFNTSNVTDMNTMFVNCPALTSLDVSSFDTAKVTNMSGMFQSCPALTSLDISSFDTAKVTDMGGMFANDKALGTIYVSDKWSTASVTSSKNMFSSCTNLPNFDSSVVDKTNAHTGEGGYLTYKRYISAADRVKVILEKGAVDIIVNKILEIESRLNAINA